MTTATGIVLAGGFSRRFDGEDKTLATLDGTPLLGHAVGAVAPVVDAVVVSCREEQVPAFEDVLTDTVTFCPDPTPDEGPLAGLAAAIDTVDAPVVALATADMPCVPTDLYRTLFAALDDSDADAAVVRDDGYLEAAPGVYRVDPLRTAIRERRAAGDARLRSMLERLAVVTVSAERVRERWGERALADVNTRSKLADLEGC